MNYELKPWNWVVASGLLAVCLCLAIWVQSIGQPVYCSSGLWLMVVILTAQAWKLYAAFWRQVDADQFRVRREALSLSAEGQMAEAFSRMHPDTARLVLNYQKTVWLIDECETGDLCEWYLKVDQRVNARFVEWLLKNSNPYSIMPMHGNLNDKKHTWDRLVSDYMMYRAFCDVLVRRHMLTEPSGNQPGMWIEPWNPERAAKRFGVSLEEEVEEKVEG